MLADNVVARLDKDQLSEILRSLTILQSRMGSLATSGEGLETLRTMSNIQHQDTVDRLRAIRAIMMDAENQ